MTAFLTIHDQTGRRIDDNSDYPYESATDARDDLVGHFCAKEVDLPIGGPAYRFIDRDGNPMFVRIVECA